MEKVFTNSDIKIESNQIIIDNITEKKASTQIDKSFFLEKLKCFFCKNLTLDINVIKCCNLVCCNSCLEPKIKQKEKCPNCKISEIVKEELSETLLSLFNSLTYPCKFKGCSENFGFSKMSQHEELCTYNPNSLVKCQTCKLDYAKEQIANHDCLGDLMKKIEILKKENEDLKTSDKDSDTIKHIKLSYK
jgi:hypothetical protein